MASDPIAPSGYSVRNINYGVELLRAAFPSHRRSLFHCLDAWAPTWADIGKKGGNLSVATRQLRDILDDADWQETDFTIGVSLNGVETVARTHKVDHFKAGPRGEFPGVGIEIEWSNKDEFFDRDLINFEALHQARGIAVGVMIVRGATLHAEMQRRFGTVRFGTRTTHWDKLMPRLDLGRGGATPLIAVGLEAERIRP